MDGVFGEEYSITSRIEQLMELLDGGNQQTSGDCADVLLLDLEHLLKPISGPEKERPKELTCLADVTGSRDRVVRLRLWISKAELHIRGEDLPVAIRMVRKGLAEWKRNRRREARRKNRNIV